MADYSKQEIAARFGAMILGGTIVDGPIPADTPLGRLHAWHEAHPGQRLRGAEYKAVVHPDSDPGE